MTALSIVVPCFNEEECVRLLHQRLSGAARTSFGEDYEIILVNDGSKDRTWPIMQEMSAADPHLTCVNLSRNHGHQLALTAGLDLARGASHPDRRRRPPGPARTACPDARGDGARRRRRRLWRAPQPRGRNHFKRATAHAFYRLLSSRDRDRHSPRRRRLPPDEPPRARRAAGDARAGPLRARDGGVDRLQAIALPLRPRRARRGRKQISAGQDDPLRARRADRVQLGAAEARQPCRDAAQPLARC